MYVPTYKVRILQAGLTLSSNVRTYIQSWYIAGRTYVELESSHGDPGGGAGAGQTDEVATADVTGEQRGPHLRHTHSAPVTASVHTVCTPAHWPMLQIKSHRWTCAFNFI